MAHLQSTGKVEGVQVPSGGGLDWGSVGEQIARLQLTVGDGSRWVSREEFLLASSKPRVAAPSSDTLLARVDTTTNAVAALQSLVAKVQEDLLHLSSSSANRSPISPPRPVGLVDTQGPAVAAVSSSLSALSAKVGVLESSLLSKSAFAAAVDPLSKAVVKIEQHLNQQGQSDASFRKWVRGLESHLNGAIQNASTLVGTLRADCAKEFSIIKANPPVSQVVAPRVN